MNLTHDIQKLDSGNIIYIKYYENGNVASIEYYNKHGMIYREDDGPSGIFYYCNGKISREY